jgi:hypothetical protein
VTSVSDLVLHHFDRSALPLPRDFYQDECGKLSRPSRGWVRSRCPLHGGDNPTSFAVNLNSGGFYCHACGAKGGDVVAFAMFRYKLDFRDACAKLGVWKSERRISASALRNLKRHRDRQNQCAEAIAERLRELRLSYRNEIHLLEQIQWWTGELMRDASITPEELEFCWSTLASILSQLRTAIAAYCLLSFATVGERLDFVMRPEERTGAIQAVLNRGTVRDDSGVTTEVDFSIGQYDPAQGH